MAPARKPSPAAQALASFKYGMPVYGLSWPEGDTFYLCGGGGSISSGIKNRIVVAQRVQGMLTDQVAELDFDKNCPMRLSIAPNGRSIALAMAQGGVKRVDIEKKSHIKLTEATGGFAERLAADRTEYKCLMFSLKGDSVALGGVDGSLKVMAWPSLDIKLHLKGDSKLDDSIRDVSLSPPSSRSLRVAAVLDNGTAELWSCQSKQLSCRVALAKGEPLKSDALMRMEGHNTTSVQQLPRGMQGARFAALRYSPASAAPSALTASAPSAHQPTLLYALMNNRQGCWVVTWEEDASTGMMSMLRYKYIGEEPSSCFDVSPCGKILAVGTSQSAIVILRAADLAILRVRQKAHTVFCTGVCFAPDSQHVLSVSGDASATLTPTEPSDDTALMIPRMFMRFVLVLGFLLTLVLFAAKTAKLRGDTETFNWIGDALRAVHIVPPSSA